MTILIAWLLSCAGCDRAGPGDRAEAGDRGAQSTAELCRVEEPAMALPRAVHETSGLTAAARGGGLWTHNDRGNAPVLFHVSATGTLLAAVRVTGADPEDWEDIAAAPCGAGRCLYLADIGDNDGKRATVTIYEVPEPAAGSAATAPARALRARYPDGAHNAEALFALDGALYIITKGDDGPVGLYRYRPGSVAAGGVVMLERVREAMRAPRSRRDLVTGAAASPNGEWVAVRTYRALYFYPARAFVNGDAIEPLMFSLSGLRELQGEAVAFGADGVIWLSSEAESGGVPGLARLRCELPSR